MTPHTDAPEGPSLRRLADAAEARLGEHGLALRDLGVLGPEDPAASHFAAAVERGFYETVPTGAALRQQLEAHAADGRRRLGVYAPGDDPAARRPAATFEDFVQPLTTWPGRTVDAWLITDVTVSPDARRRGVLRAMMLRSLADARDAGLCAAALTATEAAIYGRFGFGAATRWHAVRIDVSGAPAFTGAPAGGRVTVEEPREIPGLVDELYGRVLPATPGSVQRTSFSVPRWEDREASRNEGRGSGLYAAVHRDDDGRVQGVALYRFEGWEKEPPTITVTAFLAATADARRGLVHHLARLDLVERIEWGRAPETGWLEALFVDERRVSRHRGSDDLYLRVLNLPAAMAARGWAGDGEVVVAVEDALGAIDGTWRLTVRQGRGAAERLGPAADAVGLGAGLRLDAARFSALWLGGHSRGAGAAVLAEAGVVAELRAGAAEAFDALVRPGRPLHTLVGF